MAMTVSCKSWLYKIFGIWIKILQLTRPMIKLNHLINCASNPLNPSLHLSRKRTTTNCLPPKLEEFWIEFKLRTILKLVLVIINTACVTAPKVQATIKGIDTFGSKRISSFEISKQYDKQISDFVLAAKTQHPQFGDLKNSIEEKIKNQFGFHYVNLSLITYFGTNSGDYVTVDVVEVKDAISRMAFIPPPVGHFDDPDDLISLWNQFLEIGFELLAAGQIEYPKTCPAWHCVHSFENPKLSPFLEKFSKLVPFNEKKLLRILREDARPQFRGNAAFLLAHTHSGLSVVKYLLGAIRDPAEVVRNNSMRVLGEIAMKHPEIEIPVEPILEALNFPATTDRNKAGFTLISLSIKEKNKKLIVHSVGPILLEMLKLQQPNNHDTAFTILKNVSGQDFGERDYEAWSKWLKR